MMKFLILLYCFVRLDFLVINFGLLFFRRFVFIVELIIKINLLLILILKCYLVVCRDRDGELFLQIFRYLVFFVEFGWEVYLNNWFWRCVFVGQIFDYIVSFSVFLVFIEILFRLYKVGERFWEVRFCLVFVVICILF